MFFPNRNATGRAACGVKQHDPGLEDGRARGVGGAQFDGRGRVHAQLQQGLGRRASRCGAKPMAPMASVCYERAMKTVGVAVSL